MTFAALALLEGRKQGALRLSKPVLTLVPGFPPRSGLVPSVPSVRAASGDSQAASFTGAGGGQGPGGSEKGPCWCQVGRKRGTHKEWAPTQAPRPPAMPHLPLLLPLSPPRTCRLSAAEGVLPGSRLKCEAPQMASCDGQARAWCRPLASAPLCRTSQLVPARVTHSDVHFKSLLGSFSGGGVLRCSETELASRGTGWAGD